MQISILLALPVYISLCNDYNRCLLLASGDKYEAVILIQPGIHHFSFKLML
ncbi:hypothetical protein CK203_029536 [Vitis vinifera]|uniref:Uncharacterized protein n=1 Tax=Vitis vinifera TaxID=29760 RepID=A0A438JCD0_VITVI|nr:hypothetical protein CK203_029536 [Vitis vinifera]